MKKVHALPTLITLGNLLSGFAAITFSMRAAAGYEAPGRGRPEENLFYAALLIGLAMLCDLFDGRVARATKTLSPFGAEMDSLADIVSFGVAPAFIVKVLMDMEDLPRYYGWVLVAAYVCCGALRLARYNVESAGEPGETFVGLPIPAAAGAVGSWVLLWHGLAHGEMRDFIWGGPGLASLIVKALPFYMFALGPLMTSRVRYVHLGKKLLRGEKSLSQFVGLVLVLALVALEPRVTIVLAFNAYVVVGVVLECLRLGRRRRRSVSVRTHRVEDAESAGRTGDQASGEPPEGSGGLPGA